MLMYQRTKEGFKPVCKHHSHKVGFTRHYLGRNRLYHMQADTPKAPVVVARVATMPSVPEVTPIVHVDGVVRYWAPAFYNVPGVYTQVSQEVYFNSLNI